MSNFKPDDFDKDLLKSLEEDLKKFSSKKLIQDFVPYKDSVLWQYSDEYYRSKGIMAWSNKAPKIVPHKIGTNYQNALAFAKLVKLNLELNPSKEKVKVVEAGAGSGRFSRHFLLALRELGILDQVLFIISDYSKFNLDSIASSSVLEEFQENENYVFKVIDLTRKDDFQGLKARAFFMHYVLDALPLTILRNKSGSFEELCINTSINSDQKLNVLENDFLQSRLEHEDQWLPYQPSLEMEKKYWQFFSTYHKQSFDKELYYAYSSLEALSNIYSSLEDNGFLLNIDVLPGKEKRYIVVGNSVAHEVDNLLLKTFLERQGATSCVNEGQSISGLLVIKKKQSLDHMLKKFKELYIEENKVIEYINLEKKVEENLEAGFITGLENKLKHLTELAPYYAYTYELWSRFYKLIGDRQKAEEYLGRAEAIDYWDDV